MKLQLEINSNCVDSRPIGGVVMITPSIDETYWSYRVKLYKDQAILGFPKFGQIGVGFAKEEDWNTNLPTHCSAKIIFNHIKHNKLYDEISDNDCIKAIEMIRKAVK